MAGWHVRDALRAYKQVVSQWRKHYAFPPFHREGRDYYTSTAALADWLRRYGVAVTVQ